MKTRLSCLCLLALLLALAACGQIPTPGAGAYPLPQTPLAGLSPMPGGTQSSAEWIPVVCVDRPMRQSYCAPTPSQSERAAVQAQGLPTTIAFELQRAIYLWGQQGVPGRLAEVSIRFNSSILTITQAVTLAEQHGVKVYRQSERYSDLQGIVPLGDVPALAGEQGITTVELVDRIYADPPPPCPTRGGPTPVPITCEPGHP